MQSQTDALQDASVLHMKKFKVYCYFSGLFRIARYSGQNCLLQEDEVSWEKMKLAMR